MTKKIEKSFRKELLVIFASFFIIAIITIIVQKYNLNSVKFLHKNTEKIYKHPLEVSNAALNIKLNVLKIHRDMKDIVLTPSNIKNLINKIEKTENKVYINFQIIENNLQYYIFQRQNHPLIQNKAY